ncbi:hypothetical protein VTO42DRAFT_2096 [Malbranchea cinnamomea]
MKILDPQSAVLTNVEVLAHFTLNPPRRSPTAPPNSNPRNFTPSPDLRDHNTVVKEFQDYVTRISPHLLKYPSFYPPSSNPTTAPSSSTSTAAGSQAQQSTTTTTETNIAAPADGNAGKVDDTTTPLDNALRTLITRLKPYHLTKAEVLMMVNLGIGLDSAEQDRTQGGEADSGGATTSAGHEEGDAETADIEMQDADRELAQGEAEGAEGGGEVEPGEEDYGAMAILNTVIEDRVERLTDEQLLEILAILRETLGGKKSGGAVDDVAES